MACMSVGKNASHKKNIIAGLMASAILLGCGGSVTTETDLDIVNPTEPVSDWKLVWSDEFDGSSIDTNKWEHEVNCNGGGNQEKQCYTDSPENSFVGGGMLNIVAKPAPDGSPLPYTSARLRTKGKGDWKYGRIEMRAKMPEGQGAWPAFWMLPTDYVYGGWPKSGEIDIIEAVNLKASTLEGTPENRVYGTLHYGKEWPDNVSSGQPYTLPDGVNPADDFHTYAIEWQEGEIRWYVDGYLYATQEMSVVRYNSKGEAVGLKHRGWFVEQFSPITGELENLYGPAPFDQDFHILLNLAVGGSWPENVNDQGIDAAAFENGQTYQIDYVRVYQCSLDPATGKGCETVRAGYKDENTLVEGKAPTPTPPVPDVAVPITIFADEVNPGWALWDCCGGTTPEVVDGGDGYGNVAQFSILDNNGTVLGFNTREVDGGTPFNASAMLTTGSLKFDMKVVSPPSGDTTWMLKVESDNAASAVEVALSTSIEGEAPTTGEWQTYTFPLQALSDGGLDISSIDVIMIFPAWGTGGGAVYQIDNMSIATADVSSPELIVFEDTANPTWPLWDCCGGSSPAEVNDDAEHGVVAEFSIADNNGTVLGFLGRESGGTFDASALLSEGVIEFDMKVVTPPNEGSAVWKFKVESDSASTAVEVDLATGNGDAAPVTGEWATYRFSLSALADSGLDISAIDVLMIFPEWGKGGGTTFRVDNVKIYNPNAQGGQSASLDIFSNAENSGWPLWDDCCGPAESSVVTDDAEHGAAAEFGILDNSGTVLGFNSRDAGDPFDASSLLQTGVLRFEMKVVASPGDGTNWLMKIESDNASSAVELNLNTSTEGENPVTGEWQTYTFPLSTLSDAGLDLTAIDIVMVFPAWGTGGGAVYRLDNVYIGEPVVSVESFVNQHAHGIVNRKDDE